MINPHDAGRAIITIENIPIRRCLLQLRWPYWFMIMFFVSSRLLNHINPWGVIGSTHNGRWQGPPRWVFLCVSHSAGAVWHLQWNSIHSPVHFATSATFKAPSRTLTRCTLHLQPLTHKKPLCIRTFLLFLLTLLWGGNDGFVMTGYYTSSPLNKNVPCRHSPFLDNLQHDEVQLRAA